MTNPGPQPASNLRAGIAWALASALGSGAFMIPWKVATEHGEERDAVLLLLVTAAILNTLLVPLTPRRKNGNLRKAVALSLPLAILTLLGNEASAAAIARISAPLLSVLQRAEVVLVALLGWLALRERADPAFWAGTIFALLGVLLLYGKAPSLDHVEGVFYGLVSASSFALMIVITRRWIAGVDAVTVNGIRLWLSVGCWLLLHREFPRANQLSPGFVMQVGLAAFFGPFLARLCMMQALRFVEARIPALCLLATPAITLGLSWLILGAVPEGSELLASAIILGGVALPVVWEARRR